AVHQAREMGADPAQCAGILARLATSEGDLEQAALQLELVARAAEESGATEQAVDAYRRLLDIDPAHGDYACRYAASLIAKNQHDAAAAALKRTLDRLKDASEDALIPLYE